MNRLKLLSRTIALFAICTGMMVFAVTGCNKEDDPTDDIDNPTTVMKAAAVSGTVLDADGNPLGGVSVSTGTQNVTTGNDGAFSFEEAGMVNDRAVIHFEKSGYFTVTRSAEIDDEGEISLQTMMPRKGASAGVSLQTDFDAGSAKTLQIGAMTVVFPAGSVVNANGSAYSGKVRADMLYVAPDNKNAGMLIPDGNLAGKNSDEMLFTYGMTDVVLTDDAGKPLKIKENAGVEISFPAPADVTDASLPLWSFSENSGVWVEDGSLSRQGNAYKGTVKHFSKKATGKKAKYITIVAHVVVCDKPKAGVAVNIECIPGEYGLAPLVIFNSINPGITNSQGDCRIKLDKNHLWTGYKLTATYDGKSKSETVTDFSYGLQVIWFRFDDGCAKDGDDDFPEKLVLWGGDLHGEYWIEAWDHYGARYRLDSWGYSYSPLDHGIDISDHIKKRTIGWEEHNNHVEDYECEDEDDCWDYVDIDDWDREEFIRYHAGYSDAYCMQWYTRISDATLLERKCKVWSESLWSGSTSLYYVWKGILLLRTTDGKVEYQVKGISEVVPEKAFTLTSNVTWAPHP